MTKVLIAILIIYIAIKLFKYYLEYLNYKHINKYGSTIPHEFEGIIDHEKLQKIRNYTLEKTKFGIINSIYDTIILLIFIFGGLLNFYSSWLNEFSMPFILHGVIFFLILILAKTILDIPFSIYQTFNIEKKYGFNTMTLKTWLTDLIKSVLISIILFGILCGAAFWVIKATPNSWWLWVWGVFLAFSIFMMYISPYVLEPLFNKFSPIDDAELSTSLKGLMSKVGITVGKILKMDASKRTKHTNAYFTGIGHVKRIVLYDTTLETMNNEEILSVFAHEIGHWKKKHLLKNIIIFEIIALVALYFAYFLTGSNILLDVFNISATGTGALSGFPAKLFLLQFLIGIIGFPIGPAMCSLSRKFEREADSFACNLIGTPDNLISSLKKLSADNLSNLHPHPLYETFHYSHPSVLKRIQYLSKKGDNTIKQQQMNPLKEDQ